MPDPTPTPTVTPEGTPNPTPPTNPVPENTPVPAATAEPTPAAAPAAPAPGTPDPKATAPAQPVVLSLKLPEKALLDQAALDRTTKTLTDLKMAPEQAQTIVEHVNAEVQAYWQAKEAEAVQLRTVQWVEQVKADPEIGGAQFDASMQAAARARAKYFTPEFDKLLESSGLGNHPEFVRAWAKVGKEIGPSGIIHPNHAPAPDTAPKTIAQKLWPNMEPTKV